MKRCGDFHPNYIIVIFSALERWDWHGASLPCTKFLSAKTLQFVFSFSLFISSATFLSGKYVHRHFKKKKKFVVLEMNFQVTQRIIQEPNIDTCCHFLHPLCLKCLCRAGRCDKRSIGDPLNKASCWAFKIALNRCA